MKRKSIFKIVLVLVLLISILVILANYRIRSSSKEFIFNDVKQVPTCRTALLLGTSKYLKSGIINYYFINRIIATHELYKAGKIKYIIISGDNSKDTYNEPLDMKNELILLGIPDSVIYLDYAGFRTFDSVIRANKIFGQDSIISVSQAFHNERTVFIARHYGIIAFGYNAKDVNAYMGFKTNFREKFARFKVFVDFMIDQQPKFLGQKIKIGS